MPFESASSDSAQAESAHRETYDPMEIDEGVQFDEQPSRAEASGSVSSSAATSSGGVADGSEPYKQEYGGSAHVWTTQRDIRINLDGPHVMKCSVCGAGITISYDDMVRQFTQMKLIPCPSCEGKSLNKFVVRENKDKKGLFKLKHIPSKEGETTLVDNLQQGVGIGMKVLVHNYIVEKYPHFMSERLDDKAYDAVYDEVTIYFLGLMRAEKVGVDTLSQNTFQVKETKDSERWVRKFVRRRIEFSCFLNPNESIIEYESQIQTKKLMLLLMGHFPREQMPSSEA